mgnify:CR=1 FL=1
MIVGAIAVYLNTQIKMGNPVEGSSLLHHDSEFNTAARAINDHFPGTNTLEIILETKEKNFENPTARTPEVVEVATKLEPAE